MPQPLRPDADNSTCFCGSDPFWGRSRLLWTAAALYTLVALGLIATILALSPTNGSAQTIDEKLWIANGPVYTVVRDGGTIYIGGEFSQVGPVAPIGGGAPIDATTGAVLPELPKVAGSVFAVVSDGAGGWYIGGSFTTVGGLPRSNLAHVTSYLSVSAWSPNADGIVRALAVSGPTVYVGGDFTSIGGAARNHIAALDATTGAVTAWDPNATGFGVYALTVSGSTVYAGGGFTTVGGQARNYIAALDASTGAASEWNPNADLYVGALAVSGNIVYAGGDFTNIGGQPRNKIAALDATTGAATEWNPDAGCGCRGVPKCLASVRALAVSGSTVFAGGHFCSIGGQPRRHIAALDATTGAATAWDPNANDAVLSLALSGATVYGGGWFSSIGGQARAYIAALDATTGAATAWDPDADGYVYALAVSSSTVYAGGDFTSIGGLPQSHIAAMGDLTIPTLVSLVSAHALPDRVELTWFAPARDVSRATVYRRTVRDDWEAIGQISAEGTGWLAYADTHVVAGTRYGYRLGVMEAGQEVFLGETWVDVPVLPELTLAGFRSNPAREDLSVTFSLPDASPARLELFDVGGRRIAAREVGTLGAGSHVLTLGDARTLAPGDYLLRLSRGTRSLTARAVILR